MQRYVNGCAAPFVNSGRVSSSRKVYQHVTRLLPEPALCKAQSDLTVETQHCIATVSKLNKCPGLWKDSVLTQSHTASRSVFWFWTLTLI